MRRALPVLGLLLLISQPAVGHDDDEDDNGFQSEGGTCTKTCTLAALRPLASDTYINKGPVRSFEDVCSTTTVTTAQPQDGLGGEILARMAFRANSIDKGLVYVHTPFSVLDHVEGREAALESFLNLGADEIDIRGIKGDFVVHNVKEHIWREVNTTHGCSDIITCLNSGSCKDDIHPDILEASMPAMRERYRRSPKPELPWKVGEVYAVAVHLRRGDKHQKRSETIQAKAMDTIKQAVDDAGQNHGQPIIFHLFTQGKEDLWLLGNRSDTVIHYAKDTNQHGNSTADAVAGLKLAFHSLVMAEALLGDHSQLSFAAAWLSMGWVWGFGFNRDRMGSSEWNLFDDNGVVGGTEKVKPPVWPRRRTG